MIIVIISDEDMLYLQLLTNLKLLKNIRSMQTKQQGLVEYLLNVLNFLAVLLTDVLLVS